MKRSSTKKPVERRKRQRSTSVKERVNTKPTAKSVDHCYQCDKDLSSGDRALFVEEEVGRIFCSEACIASYFSPEIDRLEKAFFKRLSPSDLSGEERESLAHLRWITLQEPDEVWREKTLSGDHRYTLISEFQPGSRKVWSICICLFLRGEPSFLYLAFSSKNQAMVNQYRKGERIEWASSATGKNANQPPTGSSRKSLSAPRKTEDESAPDTADTADTDGEINPTDRLADAWTDNETFLAQMNQERGQGGQDDIPAKDYSQYQECLEETLEAPDEVWSVIATGEAQEPPKVKAANAPGVGEAPDTPDVEDKEAPSQEAEVGMKIFHFIRYYCEEEQPYWYLIIARETEDDEQIEILDGFPTRDPGLVDRYRRGRQEVGHLDARPTTRVVH